MQSRIIYVTGHCDQCGKMSTRLVSATIDEKDLAPVRCDSCDGQVAFSDMEVWHHFTREDSGEDNRKAGSKIRHLPDIPSAAVAEINTLVIVCLCLAATSVFERYLTELTQVQTMAVAMLFTMTLVTCWLLGRSWFRRSREREEAELRKKFQREGKFLRDMENISRKGGVYES